MDIELLIFNIYKIIFKKLYGCLNVINNILLTYKWLDYTNIIIIFLLNNWIKLSVYLSERIGIRFRKKIYIYILLTFVI